MNAPALVQQFMHLVHPDRSYRLSYLLRQFADKTGKIHKQKADKTQGEKQAQQYTRQTFIYFQKSNGFIIDLPRSNCLLCSAEAVSRCCRPIGSLANSSRAPACTFEVVDSSLSPTPTSDLNRKHSCSVPVKLKCKKPSIPVSREISPSSSIDVSTRDAPGPSDPVPIAGNRRGVPGSPDPVSTAARRGDGSHCGCGAGCERVISIPKRSTSTFI